MYQKIVITPNPANLAYQSSGNDAWLKTQAFRSRKSQINSRALSLPRTLALTWHKIKNAIGALGFVNMYILDMAYAVCSLLN